VTLGTATCASSNCHGAATARSGSDILQNEYFIWQKYDRHSKAWLALIGEDGKRIGENLGITAPQKDPLCLACHATYVPEANRGERFTLEDGVGCESCHGAAERYLRSHAQRGSTHRDNLENGMNDLVALAPRTELCLSCHQGNAGKAVTHRLIGAGHPRLTFELDTFGARQPAHWMVDDDYLKRKGEYHPIHAWLVGQTLRARRAAELSANAPAGAYPELSTFYCYSCHHSLSEQQWKSRDYHGHPGELRPNIASLLVVQHALGVLDGGLAKKLDPKASPGDTKETLDRAASLFETVNVTRAQREDLLHALMSWCAGERFLPYEVAEQIAMGAASILAEDAALAPSDNLQRIFATLKLPASMNPEQFSAACGTFFQKP
jgi:hypothetical protein